MMRCPREISIEISMDAISSAMDEEKLVFQFGAIIKRWRGEKWNG